MSLFAREPELRGRISYSAKLKTALIIIVMQRLHADDLVAHVQKHENWTVMSLPVLATEDYEARVYTAYGWATLTRKQGDILQPGLLSRADVEVQRRGMTEYNFAAQYQQGPEPPSGIIVKRDWLKFYSVNERPERFRTVLQSWDTANKETELSNFSVCTTWGIDKGRIYLLDVYRERVEFPDLKKAVRRLAVEHKAKVVLVEDKASGTSLIQELLGFSNVQAARLWTAIKSCDFVRRPRKLKADLFCFRMRPAGSTSI